MQFIELSKTNYRALIYPLFIAATYLYFCATAFGQDQGELNTAELNTSELITGELNTAELNIAKRDNIFSRTVAPIDTDLGIANPSNTTGRSITGTKITHPPEIAQRSRLTVSIGHNLSTINEDQSNKSIANVVSRIQHIVDNTGNHLTNIFLYTPKNTVSLKILSPEDFFKVTGAPNWTSALYYNGTIFIPLSPGLADRDSAASKENMNDLYSAIKHEYIHAFLAELSGNRIPAWLDEGIAQYLEGQDNPRLAPALRNWLAINPPLPLDNLDHGFTTLKASSVVVAYAESLFITRSLINRYGISKVAKVIKLLGQRESLPISIKVALDIEKSDLEQDLARQLKAWAVSRKTSL